MTRAVVAAFNPFKTLYSAFREASRGNARSAAADHCVALFTATFTSAAAGATNMGPGFGTGVGSKAGEMLDKLI